MEDSELAYIKAYAERLSDSKGDLTQLTKEECHHLILLFRKYELELTLDKINEDLSQIKY